MNTNTEKKTEIVLNVALLRQVQAKINEEPKRLNMDVWFLKSLYYMLPSERPACGIVGCIAGWACHLSNINMESPLWRGWLETGRDLIFGPQPDYSPILYVYNSISRALFFTTSWLEDYEERYVQAKSSEERTKVTSDYIDYFINNFDSILSNASQKTEKENSYERESNRNTPY